jgi:hypothetical protein
MHVGLGLLSRGYSIQRIDCHVSTRPREVLPSVHNPLEDGYDDNDCECGNTVIWKHGLGQMGEGRSQKILTHATPCDCPRWGEHK